MPGIAKFAFVPHFVVLMILGTLRIGEATVPGPWALGCLNPNSLLGKADQIACLPDGVYAISESSLTSHGVERFRKELKSRDNTFRFCAGHPAPHRSVNSIGGKPVGTGFISKCPSRVVDPGWTSLHESSRLCAARFFVDQDWVLGGTAYGYAQAAITKAVCEATDRLLHELTNLIVINNSGPRFIAGDWNQELHRLQEPRIWEQHGFVEIQNLAQAKFGILPSVTCKGCTRKDFVYVSRELAERIQSVHIDATLFPDHSVLYAILRDTGTPERTCIWRIPQPLPWTPELVESVRNSESQVNVEDQHPTQAYRTLCQVFEKDVQVMSKKLNVPELHVSHFGRGQTLHRTFKPQKPSPVKPSRAGEKTPGYHGTNLEYKRCFKQLRRLVNYQRLAKEVDQTPSQRAHKIALWSAIVRSPGFDGSFGSWWRTHSESWPGAPSSLPAWPPDKCTAEILSQAMHAHVERLETTLRMRAFNQAREVRQRDTNAIFRDIQKPRAMPVDTLVTQVKVAIVDIDTEENAIVVDRKPDFLPGQPIFGSTGLLQVIHSDEDKLWVANTDLPQPGECISQQLLHGTIKEIQEKFLSEWKKRWQQHAHMTDADWQPLLQVVDDALADQTDIPQMQLKFLDGPLIRKFVASKKSKAAIGMDGISRQDMLAMSTGCLDAVASIFRKAETTGRWPSQMLHGAVSALQKHETASQVHEYRPITIYSMAYRIWSSCRSREVLAHLSRYAPAGVKGNRANSSSVELWWKLQQTVEYHLLPE